MKSRQSAASSAVAQQLQAVLVESLFMFIRIKAMGPHEGMVTPMGGGVWGLLHTLVHDRPRTVAQFARERPASRQHVQKLADELEAQGLLRFVPNPAHKRSPLMQITPAGEVAYRRMNQRMAELSERFATQFKEDEVATTARVLREFREAIEQAWPERFALKR